MLFSEIAAHIGIDKYPQTMDGIYETIKNDAGPACDLVIIKNLQRQYDVFGKYYADVVETAQQINEDCHRSAWVKTAAAYAMGASAEETKRIPGPAFGENKVDDYLRLHMLIPLIPTSIAEYEKRGFSQEEITHLLASYKLSMSIVEEQTGRPGINVVYLAWMSIFAKAGIFETDGLQFELYQLPQGAVYLKNRESGDVTAVLTQGLFHASGIQLVGAKGFEEEEGSFSVTFREDGENYYGHRSLCKTADRNIAVFPKDKWEIAAKAGDDCLSIHIPRNADISPTTLDKAIANAQNILETRFPEHKGSMIYAASWILDPTLEEFMSDSSNLIRFARRFVRYPQKSDGMHVFGFVFPKRFESYESLPETSSLTRGLKRVYMEGRYIYFYHGLII